MKKHILTATVLTLALGLGGCGSVKNTFGFGRNSPDEFTVVKRAPLSLPPSYSLRPPQPGATGPVEQSTTSVAKTAVFGTPAQTAEPSKEQDSGEYGLLQALGTERANPEIRDILDNDAGYVRLNDKSVAEKLIFWHDDTGTTDETVVDAPAEAARIHANKNQGKPLNEGDVPTIEKKQSTIDKIF